MKKDQIEKKLRILFRWIRSAGLYLFAMLFSVCSRVIIVLFNYDNRGQFHYISTPAVHAASLALSLVFYFSLIRTATLHHNPTKNRYFAAWDRSAPSGLREKLRFLIRSPEMLPDLAMTLFFLVVFPLSFGHQSLAFLLGTHGNKGMVLLIMLPTLTLFLFAGKISALTVWSDDWLRHRRVTPPEDISPLRTLGKLFVLWLIFSAGCAVMPMVLVTLNAFRKMFLLVDPKIFIPIILGLLIFRFLLRFLVIARKRRKFLRDLRMLCGQTGFEVSDVKKWRQAIFFPTAESNFSLRKGNARYDCRFFSCPNRFSPLTFHEDGTVTCTHTLRLFGLVLFSYNFTYEFQFPADGKRLLVVLPAPRKTFIDGYGVTLLAESGARISDCRIFGGKDFLNAVERNVLDG